MAKTRQQAFQEIQDYLDKIEDEEIELGLPLFHVSDYGYAVAVVFNDPRTKNLEVEYDSSIA